ncbi:hypothetical protein FANTH_12255 [Fusarium anthophilum]|uniref:Kinesin light chain n=1 Tax=Fusarium anthophilum TaxID=48485 RepID=A0A8H5DSJ5_9HYPO|nr:hypothetical protein FANTH_12255 [Fusarium anthophilum]
MSGPKANEPSDIPFTELVPDALISDALVELGKRGQKEDPDSSIDLDDMVGELVRFHKLDLAQKFLDIMVKAGIKFLGQKHPITLNWMANLGALYAEQEKYLEAAGLLQQALDRMKTLDNHPDLLYCKKFLIRAYKHLRYFEKAKSLVDKMISDERSHGENPENDHRVADMQLVLASIYEAQNLLDEARNITIQAIRVQAKMLGSRHRNTLASMRNLARLRYKEGRAEEAIQILSPFVTIMEQELGKDDPDTLFSKGDLALYFCQQGRQREAEVIHRQLLGMFRERFGSKHKHTSVCMENLSSTLVDLGECPEAEELQLQIIETRKSVLGGDHETTIISKTKLVYIRCRRGRHEEAKDLGEEVVEESRKVMGEDHINTLAALENLALTCERMGSFQKAVQIRKDVLERKRELFGKEDIETLRSEGCLAIAHAQHDGYREAKPMLMDVLEKMETLGAHHPNLISYSNNMAGLMLNEKHFKEAEEMMMGVLKAKRKVMGTGHPETISEMCNLALGYKEQGKLKEACSLMREAPELKFDQLGKGDPFTLVNQANQAYFFSLQDLVPDPIDRQRMEEGLGMLRQILKGMERTMDKHQKGRIECGKYITQIEELLKDGTEEQLDGSLGIDTISDQLAGRGNASSGASSTLYRSAKRHVSALETPEPALKKLRRSGDEINCPDES